MRSHHLITLLAAAVAGCTTPVATTTDTSSPTPAFNYPTTAEVDQVDDYHGTPVSDPYRWLEDDVRVSNAVLEWVTAQNEVTFSYLESLPQREKIRARLTQLWDYEKFGVPFREAGRYFYSYNNGLQNQSVLLTQTSLDAEPRILLDPNGWSDDGTVALSGYVPSPDGRYLAYGVQDGGSDWRTWKFLDIDSGAELDDQVDWVKFSGVAWDGDGQGIFYARYPATGEGEKFQTLNHNHTVYYHRLGTPQSEDQVIYARPDHPDWGFAPNVTDDGRFLVLTVWKGTDDRYQVVYKDLQDAAAEPVMLIEGFDYEYALIGNDDTTFYFKTTNGAPRGRMIAIDIDNPAPANWREIIPQTADVLDDISYVGDHFIAEYLRDARTHVQVYTQTGAPAQTVDLPGVGTASGFEGYADNSETFYVYSSFNEPPTIYRYDVGTDRSTLFRAADVDFEPSDYVVKQVFYESRDGTRVPMFIAHHKSLQLDGSNPTLLYGYGGFNIPMRPGFSITRMAWMEMGGVYAVANLRGGGEYGEKWHKAGTKLQKQNVFDDFIAAGEFLVEQDYTQPSQLGIFGGSNGGLLVGAVLNQRPDLFGAALPAVGVMDMLRFHKFTAGRFWVDDYGSADDPDEFAALYAYSPYHNIADGKAYPPVLVTTADTDDRVVPGHSFKYIAALQAAQAGDAPVLIRIETRAGHGSGKPTSKIIEEYADRWAFLAEHLGLGT
ncbi:MAG: S9 family peptidase [Gammaproteobacteria bacterium]|nr:S9 family peptidase [Gammaproteobacteria bacterium]